MKLWDDDQPANIDAAPSAPGCANLAIGAQLEYGAGVGAPSFDAAANTAEIETMAWRLRRFADLGLPDAIADRLADQLLRRDREGADHASCAECRYGAGRQCPDGAPLPIEVLHRCLRFEAGGHIVQARTDDRPTGLDAMRRKEADWPLFLAEVRRQDALRGGPAMRCADGGARHPDGSRPPANSQTTTT